MNAPNPLIRDTAHWLIAELYDELPAGTSEGLKNPVAIWLTGFRYINAMTRNNPNGHWLFRRARKEAIRYYSAFFVQRQHTEADRAYFVAMLTQALLLSCG